MSFGSACSGRSSSTRSPSWSTCPGCASRPWTAAAGHPALPGIAAAALLAFSLSFDDYIVTNFNSGGYTTFPKFVYVSATRGIPPQANVISSFMFFLVLALVIAVQVVMAGRRRRARG